MARKDPSGSMGVLIFVGIIGILALFAWQKEAKLTGLDDAQSRVARNLKYGHSTNIKYKKLWAASPENVVDGAATFYGVPSAAVQVLKTVIKKHTRDTNTVVGARAVEEQFQFHGSPYVVMLVVGDVPDSDYFIAGPGKPIGWLAMRNSEVHGTRTSSIEYHPAVSMNTSGRTVNGAEKIMVLVRAEHLMPANPSDPVSRTSTHAERAPTAERRREAEAEQVRLTAQRRREAEAKRARLTAERKRESEARLARMVAKLKREAEAEHLEIYKECLRDYRKIEAGHKMKGGSTYHLHDKVLKRLESIPETAPVRDLKRTIASVFARSRICQQYFREIENADVRQDAAALRRYAAKLEKECRDNKILRNWWYSIVEYAEKRAEEFERR